MGRSLATLLLSLLLSPPALAGRNLEKLWAQAQEEIAGLDWVDGDPHKVSMDRIEVIATEGRMPCNGEKALGCFRVIRLELPTGEVREYGRLYYGVTLSGRVQWTPRKFQFVVKHEMCHAILWALGEERWADYGHGHEITSKKGP